MDRRALLWSFPGLAAFWPFGATQTRCITPTGAGARDGSSWADAGAITQLNAFIAAVGPGGEIALGAGLYNVPEPLALSAGGARNRPVIVRGAPGAIVEIAGARAEPFSPTGAKGVDCFRLLAGADYLTFRGLHFRNIGNGCVRIAAPVRGLTIEECSFHNVYRFIENTVAEGATDAALRDFIVRRCSGTNIERSFLRLRYVSGNGLIEDCTADSEGVQGDPFAVGCALDGTAHDITYRRCIMLNFRQIAPGHYWNGDGFSDELGNHGIRYEACTAAGCTDGGFDCKSTDATFERCVARDNKRNFRIWGQRPALYDCVSETPNWRGAGQERGGPAHIWCGGAGARIRIDNLTVTDEGATTLFVVHADDVGIDLSNPHYDIQDSTTTLDAAGHADVRLSVSP